MKKKLGWVGEGEGGWSKLILFIFFSINPGARVSDFFLQRIQIYIYIYI